MRRFLVTLCMIASACTDQPPDAVRAEPDSVDVVVVRHDADAFAKAPQWTVDSQPVVVYDGGAQPEFDLTRVSVPVRLGDGRLLALDRLNGGRLMLFDASGHPVRVVARSGNGPGELMAPHDPMLVGGDTVSVDDEANGRVTFFSADKGLLRSKRLALSEGGPCSTPHGMLANGRVLRVYRCSGAPPAGRLPTLVMTSEHDLAAIDTVAVLPGAEFVPFVTRYRGVEREHPMPLRFYRDVLATAWDSTIVTANGEDGYVLEFRTPGGAVQRRVVVDQPRRPVTDAMREAQVEKELSRMSGGGERMADVGESRRQAREMPFADSLPPYARLLAVNGGWLWVVDYAVPPDTTWAATAFTRDGEVAARLTSSKAGGPVWFSADEVMVRETDDDDVVRFVVYRIAKRE